MIPRLKNCKKHCKIVTFFRKFNHFLRRFFALIHIEIKSFLKNKSCNLWHKREYFKKVYFFFIKIITVMLNVSLSRFTVKMIEENALTKKLMV